MSNVSRQKRRPTIITGVGIAIVDDSGHRMYLQREKVQLSSIDAAITKAETALKFRRPTQFREQTLLRVGRVISL